MNILRKLTIFFTFIFIMLFFLTIDAVYENIDVDNQIKSFVERGVYTQTINDVHYYEVDIKEELNSPSIEIINGRPYVTTPGDIFVHRESVLDILPFVAQFISFYFGGHAGIVYDKDYVIETTGMESDPEDNVVIKGSSRFLYEYLQRSVIGLRVKATDEEVDKALDFATSAVGKKYNYSFVFNRKNTFYCTDLVARSFSKEAGLSFDLDKDGIAVSCNDLIVSDDTFITYYMYYIDGEKHLYYAV